jgi:ubiquinone biosynthesis protein UbiJ
MKTLILEQAINHFIEQTHADLTPLSGRTVYLQLQDVPIVMDAYFVCANERVFVVSECQTPSDVFIQLKPSIFLALLQGEAVENLLKADQIVINGDVKTAQLLVDLLQSIELDWEEFLSYYTNDIIAHQVGDFVKQAPPLKEVPKLIKDAAFQFLIQPNIVR